ncbi:MAG: alanine racemase [Phycisphaerales bacterium]|nr:MAG: alanine racemase [Phycisphaerales bacterium]
MCGRPGRTLDPRRMVCRYPARYKTGRHRSQHPPFPPAASPARAPDVQPTSRIDIDLDAIEHNVRTIRALTGASVAAPVDAANTGGAPDPALARQGMLCAIIKADAYGLGAPPIARRLEAAGVELLGVYTPEQARDLLAAGVTRTAILLLMPSYAADLDGLLLAPARAGRLHASLHSPGQLESLARRAAQLGVRLPVHVEVDTGMRRGGSRPDDAATLVEMVASSSSLRLAGVYSHFASADRDDATTRAQAAMFEAWIDGVRAHIPQDCVAHQSNTFGVFRARALHRDMVRVGLALYGYALEEAHDAQNFEHREHAASLRPAVHWETRLIHATRVEPGERVGYGGTWSAQRPSRIGLAPVGYADGYPLAISNRAMVGLRDASGTTRYAPLVGAVSMDQITIDLTDLPETCAHVGASVELVGVDREAPTHLPSLARAAGTSTHELLCRMSPRLPRRYFATDLARAEIEPRDQRLSTSVR